jgi:hypothetical protein
LISSVELFIVDFGSCFTWESSVWVDFGRIVRLVQRRVPIVIDSVKIAKICSSKRLFCFYVKEKENEDWSITFKSNI